jgi:hypothetical protein
VALFNGAGVPVDVQMKWYDVCGAERTYDHMQAGWSWASDMRFDWFKQNASRLEGINQTDDRVASRHLAAPAQHLLNDYRRHRSAAGAAPEA